MTTGALNGAVKFHFTKSGDSKRPTARPEYQSLYQSYFDQAASISGGVLSVRPKSTYLLQRGVKHPMRRPVADRFAGEVVDQLPMDAVRASRDAQPATLALAKPAFARALVLPVDAQIAHLVASRRIGLSLVFVDAKQLVIVGKCVRPFGFAVLARTGYWSLRR